ncbi:HEAT repeat domain-containing protein [Simiduia curdlanivorans]|uniref:HEAT repeat domain-containing protein n=1 Tax=Simiduia curdlanivorans TaxID=1492769 RepID=A0ABV8V8M5_9GAMM|nr:HEAT repeat domain-containing protein [Simiduia curdlanivorans]MDN3640667.1 HEAT repeat domain-containing protein [Simiduia curdlanivorans]
MDSVRKTIKGLKLAGLIAATLLVQACASNFTFQVEVDDPEPSTQHYVSSDQDTPTSLAFSHQIPGDQVSAKGGVLNYVYQQDKKNIDPATFFLGALSNELEARKLPVTFDDSASNQLQLLSFETISHRNNGFSPLVMIAMVKIDLVENGQKHRIAAIVKRAKVPIWTVTEEPLVEATINQPQEILIKEVAAKINLALFNDQLTDSDVDTLIKDVKANVENEDIAYQKVYELGFSNNPKALPALLEFSKHNAEYIRLAAISGMGMLGGEGVFEELKALYTSGNQWQDRAVALKAIGDIQTTEALDFLKTEQAKWSDKTTQEVTWNKKIVALYLD